MVNRRGMTVVGSGNVFPPIVTPAKAGDQRRNAPDRGRANDLSINGIPLDSSVRWNDTLGVVRWSREGTACRAPTNQAQDRLKAALRTLFSLGVGMCARKMWLLAYCVFC
jgi:hypothetical protein